MLGGSLGATEKLLNGGFENGSLSSWNTIYVADSPDTSFASSVESTEPLSGDHSARLDFKGPETDDWRMRFEQLFSAQADNFYQARFVVRSSHPITLLVQVIENGGPFANFSQSFNIPADVPMALRLSGKATWSGTTRLSFVFGGIDTEGETLSVWIDDASVQERGPTSSTAEISIDFNQTEAAADLTGLLLGLGTWYGIPFSEPGDQFITPLKLRYWRTMQDYDYIDRVLALGAKPIVLRDISWWAGDQPGNTDTPWADGYARLDDEVDALATAYGTQIIYEVWNEPDLPDSFANYEGGTFEQYLELFERVHNRIRAIVPDAEIIGPSLSGYLYNGFDWALLQQFMDFCKANNLSVQALSLHAWDADENIELMREDLLRVREQFIDNPEYASVGVQRLLVTEYAYDAMRMRPGSNLAMVRLMEEGLVDGATTSCWNHLRECTGNSSCFDGTLSGMLTCDRSAPRPLWWAKKWYADSVGGRVAATTDNQAIVPIASNHSGSGQVILASRGYNGPAVDMTDVTVHFNNLVAAGIADAGDSHIPIYVYRTPYTDLDAVHTALLEPDLLTATTVPITDGNANFTLSGTVNGYDAVLIRFSEAETLDFSPLPLGQWTGAGGNAILGNAANWADSTLPTDDTALWNGPGIEPLQLTFNANFGTRADESGTRFRLGSEQSGTLSITNNASASCDINWLSSSSIDAFHMEAGAGAFTLGASGDPVRVVVGASGVGLKTTHLHNDSASTATFGANVSWLTGGGRTQNLHFNGGGSGGFTVLGPLRVNQANNEGLDYNLSVTVNLTGGGVLTLGGDNASMTGPVTVNNAILALAHDNALGVGTLNLNGPTHNRLQSFDTTPRTIATPVTLSRSAVFGTPGTGDLTFAGSWAGGSLAKTLTVDGIRMDIQQALSGNGTRTKDGSGTLVLSGDNSSSSSAFAVAAGTLLIDGIAPSGTTTVAANAALGGSGTLPGNLILENGAGIVFDAGDGLTVNGATADLGNLSIAALVGLASSTPNGEYILLNGSAVFNFSAVQNLGGANAVAIAEGKYAFFREGSLRLVVTDAYGVWTDTFELSGTDAEPTADPDGDGLSNEEEFILGTEPNNPNSRYVVNSQVVDPQVGIPHFTIHFDTVAGRSYRVQRSLDLSPDSWEPIGDGPISGDGNPASVSDPLGEKAFYRVKVILE